MRVDRQKLHEKLIDNRLSLRKCAELTGLSHMTLYNILNGKVDHVQTETAIKLMDCFGSEVIIRQVK